jgi:hypothetical protein
MRAPNPYDLRRTATVSKTSRRMLFKEVAAAGLRHSRSFGALYAARRPKLKRTFLEGALLGLAAWDWLFGLVASHETDPSDLETQSASNCSAYRRACAVWHRYGGGLPLVCKNA